MAVIVVPGSNSIYVVSRTIERGARHGVYAALAIGLASLLYALIVALGLGTIIADRPDVLMGVQLLGAAYLLYLGLRTVFAARTMDRGAGTRQSARAAGGLHTFGEALMVCLLNPKVVVFLLAFLPQFVTGGAGSQRARLAILGLLFALLGTLWAAVLAVGTALVGSRLQRGRLPTAAAPVVSGSLLIGLSLLATFNALA